MDQNKDLRCRHVISAQPRHLRAGGDPFKIGSRLRGNDSEATGTTAPP